MQAALKRPNLATQVGNQGHSEANYFQFKAWMDAGIIKDVTAVDAHEQSAPLAQMGYKHLQTSRRAATTEGLRMGYLARGCSLPRIQQGLSSGTMALLV